MEGKGELASQLKAIVREACSQPLLVGYYPVPTEIDKTIQDWNFLDSLETVDASEVG